MMLPLMQRHNCIQVFQLYLQLIANNGLSIVKFMTSIVHVQSCIYSESCICNGKYLINVLILGYKFLKLSKMPLFYSIYSSSVSIPSEYND